MRSICHGLLYAGQPRGDLTSRPARDNLGRSLWATIRQGKGRHGPLKTELICLSQFHVANIPGSAVGLVLPRLHQGPAFGPGPRANPMDYEVCEGLGR